MPIIKLSRSLFFIFDLRKIKKSTQYHYFQKLHLRYLRKMEKYRYFRNNIFNIYLFEENEKVDISCSIYLYVKDIYICKDRIKRKEKAEDVGGHGRAGEESTRLFRVWNALVIAAHRGGWQWLRSWVRDVTSLQRCGTLTPALTNLGETKISHGQSPATCRVILGRPRLSLSLSLFPPRYFRIFSPAGACLMTGTRFFLNIENKK